MTNVFYNFSRGVRVCATGPAKGFPPSSYAFAGPGKGFLERRIRGGEAQALPLLKDYFPVLSIQLIQRRHRVDNIGLLSRTVTLGKA